MSGPVQTSFSADKYTNKSAGNLHTISRASLRVAFCRQPRESHPSSYFYTRCPFLQYFRLNADCIARQSAPVIVPGPSLCDVAVRTDVTSSVACVLCRRVVHAATLRACRAGLTGRTGGGISAEQFGRESPPDGSQRGACNSRAGPEVPRAGPHSGRPRLVVPNSCRRSASPLTDAARRTPEKVTAPPTSRALWCRSGRTGSWLFSPTVAHKAERLPTRRDKTNPQRPPSNHRPSSRRGAASCKTLGVLGSG